MSISRQNLSIVIVTFQSEAVIHECIKSIDKEIKILIIENSNDLRFKEKLESTYENVTCLLSSNLGMGCGNNIGIKMAKTDFILVLNPDIIFEDQAIDKLIIASQNISNFAILAPMSSNINYPNYKLFDKKEIITDFNSPIKVKSVDGFAMLFNKKRLDKIIKNNYFDENIFMYLENDDLCKRIYEKKENIFIIPTARIKHLGGKAVDIKYKSEVELSRNWHWAWSKFYFNKKHHGYFYALIKDFPKFFSSTIKFCYYSLINNTLKKKIYLNRASGFLNAARNKPSWYRPNINS
jgi:N-acetylglucosaminyl-diphospho-decaprenol L-rhamnosyltransferase